MSGAAIFPRTRAPSAGETGAGPRVRTGAGGRCARSGVRARAGLRQCCARATQPKGAGVEGGAVHTFPWPRGGGAGEEGKPPSVRQASLPLFHPSPPSWRAPGGMTANHSWQTPVGGYFPPRRGSGTSPCSATLPVSRIGCVLWGGGGWRVLMSMIISQLPLSSRVTLASHLCTFSEPPVPF